MANFFAQNGPIIGFIVGVVISGAFNFLLGIIKEVVKWLGDAIVSLNKFIDIAGRTDWNKPQDVLNFWQSLSNVPVLRDFLHLVPNLGVPLKDAGGSYSANQPYLVGTGAQPELFMPSSPGFAIPNFSMGALAAAMPISSPSSYAYNNTYNNQSQMGDVNFNGVGGMDDARRRYAVLRAMGRVR